MGRADVYIDPTATDPVLAESDVRRMAQEFLPDQLDPESFDVDESGGEARAYLLGGIVVKVQRPHRRRARTSLAKEAAVLKALAEPLPGRVPSLHGYGVAELPSGRHEFLVLSRIPGHAVRSHSGPVDMRPLLSEVADILQSVHAIEPETIGGLDTVPTDDAADTLFRRLEDWFADLVELAAGRTDRWRLPVSPGEVALAAIDALPRELVLSPRLLHSNPGPSHVFVDRRGALTGLIDFGDAYASHPALDLRSWPDPDHRIALRDAYSAGADAGSEFEAIWTVAMMVADMNAIIHRPDLGDRARRDLKRRLASL